MSEQEQAIALPQPNTEAIEGGAFMQSLVRNNAKIRRDRAVSIAEDTQLMYKRELENMQIELKKLRRVRDNMLDLSPSDAQSLILAADFKSAEFVKKDMQLGIDMRNLEIAIDLATKRYTELFGAI